MTSSTVSSESVARQERRDPCGIDPYPAAVSSKQVERQEREDPCSSEISEEQLLTKPTKTAKTNKRTTERTVRHVVEGTGRPVPFRNTGMAARIHRKSCG